MLEIDPLIPLDMAASLACYDTEAAKILQQFINTIEAKNPPALLYHYTDYAGLKGIIKTGKLRFSDIFRVNDPSELRHGLRIAIDILKSRAKSERPEIATFASQFERFYLDGGIEKIAHFFIACFSCDGDDLGQWRAYADNGRGFALGFNTVSLEDAFVKKEGKPVEQHSTFPIAYADAELTRIQTELVDLVDPLISLPRFTEVNGGAMHAYMRELLVSHSVNVIRGVMFFKHEAYKNETEYRFQQPFQAGPPVPDVKYKPRSKSEFSYVEQVRYREFDWRSAAPGPLKKIVIGPAADRAKAARFVKDCLITFHAEPNSVELVYSKIPYRV